MTFCCLAKNILYQIDLIIMHTPIQSVLVLLMKTDDTMHIVKCSVISISKQFSSI